MSCLCEKISQQNFSSEAIISCRNSRPEKGRSVRNCRNFDPTKKRNTKSALKSQVKPQLSVINFRVSLLYNRRKSKKKKKKRKKKKEKRKKKKEKRKKKKE